MSSLGKFYKRYGAYLLQRSNEEDTPGELYEQMLLSRRLKRLDTNVSIRLNLPEADRADLSARLRAVRKVNASFPDIDLTREIGTKADLDLPNVLEELKAELKVDQISSFRFSGVLEQRLTDDLRLELEQLIDQVEDTDPVRYKTHLKRYEMATSLFYAKEVIIKRKSGVALSAAAKAKVAEIGGTVTVGVDNEEEIRYRQDNCPFAAAIVHIKDIEA